MRNENRSNATIDDKECQTGQPHLDKRVVAQVFEKVTVIQPRSLQRHYEKLFTLFCLTCAPAQNTVITVHLNAFILRRLPVITGKKHKYHKKYYKNELRNKLHSLSAQH